MKVYMSFVCQHLEKYILHQMEVGKNKRLSLLSSSVMLTNQEKTKMPQKLSFYFSILWLTVCIQIAQQVLVIEAHLNTQFHLSQILLVSGQTFSFFSWTENTFFFSSKHLPCLAFQLLFSSVTICTIVFYCSVYNSFTVSEVCQVKNKISSC